MVSVIIVTCQAKDYLKACLDSLEQQAHKDIEVIVIDNSLDPAFAQQITKRYPFIQVYSSAENLFYSGGLNKGIKVSRGDFILCLNDDIILDKSYIQEALKGFSIDSKIGMVGGKVLRYDGKTIDSTGLSLTPWRTAKERGYGLRDTGQFEEEGYIFGVNGAVAFYRKKMLEDTKADSDYFDTNYRMFYEDLDIAWRAQNSGWKAYYIPQAVAYHLRGGSARKGSGINKPYARRYLNDGLQRDLIKNRYLTFIKNESPLGFLIYLPFILLYDLLVLGYILFFRQNLIKKIFLDFRYVRPTVQKRRLFRAKRRHCVAAHI